MATSSSAAAVAGGPPRDGGAGVAGSDLFSPPWGSVGRSLTLGLVSGFAKLVLKVLNETVVLNEEGLTAAVTARGEGQGLLTVCNHVSMFDDPGIISAMLPWRYFWFDPVYNYMRWSLCAREVCFKNDLFRQFFQNGKTLPVERGRGVHQPVVSLAAEALSRGEWVHVFPEAKINYDGRLGRLRWGAGKLLCEAHVRAGGRDPIVLPFFHSGMGRVLPLRARGFGVGHEVVVLVGDPIPLADLTCKCGAESVEEQQATWAAITERVRQALLRLEAQLPPNIDQTGPGSRQEAAAAAATTPTGG